MLVILKFLKSKPAGFLVYEHKKNLS